VALVGTKVEQLYKLLGQVHQVVMGDLNACTGQIEDNIIHDAVPDSMPNHVCGTHTKGITKLNIYGSTSTTGLHIANGRCGLDKGIGRFSCHTANGSSVIDSVLAHPCKCATQSGEL